MASMFDDLTRGFKSFSDTLEQSFTSIEQSTIGLLSRPSKFGSKLQAAADDPVLSAKAKLERDAAYQRAELILQQLPPSYFDQTFDPLEHELRQMGDEAKQDDVDGVVDRLAAAVEVVSVRLAKHVIKNQDKLIAGITNVTQVEDDLRAAHVICQGTRSQLKMAAEEVQRQIKVITCTRKKQAYMEVLEVVSKIKQVKDLQHALRRIHEEGDFGEAVLLCVDCFHAVEALGAYKVAPELRVTVQRQYFDTLQRLDTALQNECSNFTPKSYSKLLEAYLLQGLPGPALAGKVLSCYKDSINDAAVRLVRSMVLAKAAFSSNGSGSNSSGSSSSGASTVGSDGSSSVRTSYSGLGDCTFEDLCKKLSPEMVQPCLQKMLEVVFELLCSYHHMSQWHKAGIQKQNMAAAAAAAAASAAASAVDAADGDNNGSGDSTGAMAAPSQAQLDQVQAATKNLLEAVAAGLDESRAAMLDIASARVKELLTSGVKCKGEDFPKVVDSCLQYVSLGEAFAASPLSMRAAMLSALATCIESYHKSNMDALKLSLALEDWQPVSGQDTGNAPDSNTIAGQGMDVGSIKQRLSSSPYMLPVYGQPGSVADFDVWLQAGNPFKHSRSRVVGGQSVIPAALGHTAAPVQPAPPAAASHSRVTTKSSLLVLRWMNNYAALMPPLPARQAVLWSGIAELFDNFLLACFILFSGVSLEALVWQDDVLPHRLRSALLRITTSSGCKYKAQVEELQRTKPAAPVIAAPSSSFLDFGFSSSGPSIIPASTGSKLDAFTRKFKDTMVELINTDLSQPLPNSSSSPSSYAAQPQAHAQRQQQQQQHPAQTALQPGKQQQQQPGSNTPVQPQADSSAAGSVKGDSSNSSINSSSNSSTPAVAGRGHSMMHEGMHYQVPGPTGQPLGLKERVVAIESLTSIAETLKAAKPALLALLSGVGMAKEVEGYLARTVDAAQDLRDAIYRGGAKQLLVGVVDPDRGTAAQISSCNYFVREPATRYQPWAEALVKQYKAFNEFIAASGLPPDVQQKMWEAAVKLGSDAILDGLSRVLHCTLEGRAGMSLDLSAVEKGLRPIAPSSALASLRLVDNYIKAFYTPWDDLARWAQIHLAEYGKAKIVVLIEVMAEAYGIKRAQKAALIDKLNSELAEFS